MEPERGGFSGAKYISFESALAHTEAALSHLITHNNVLVIPYKGGALGSSKH